jgi:hypothetical protein
MNPTWQILIGVAIAYAPMAAVLVFLLWRDGAFSPSPQDQPDIFTTPARKSYCRLASEIRDYALHLNDPLQNQHELGQRINFIRSCRLVMTTVGFDVGVHQWAGRIIDDDDKGPPQPL